MRIYEADCKIQMGYRAFHLMHRSEIDRLQGPVMPRKEKMFMLGSRIIFHILEKTYGFSFRLILQLHYKS